MTGTTVTNVVIPPPPLILGILPSLILGVDMCFVCKIRAKHNSICIVPHVLFSSLSTLKMFC